MSEQLLPFLDFTADDINSMNPIDGLCTVLCEVISIKPKAGKKNPNSTNFVYTFQCVDDNSPYKGRNGYKTIPKDYPGMHADIYVATQCMDKADLQPGSINPNSMIGKKLYIKFELLDDGRGGAGIQPAKYFRADRDPS